MAGYTSRNILICAFPAVVALMTLFWYRRKKRRDEQVNLKKQREYVIVPDEIYFEQVQNGPKKIEKEFSYSDDCSNVNESIILSEKIDILSETNNINFNTLLENKNASEIVEHSEINYSISLENVLEETEDLKNNYSVNLENENVLETTESSESKCLISVPENLNAIDKNTVDNTAIDKSIVDNSTIKLESIIYENENQSEIIGASVMTCDNEGNLTNDSKSELSTHRIISEESVVLDNVQISDKEPDVCISDNEFKDQSECCPSVETVKEETEVEEKKIVTYECDNNSVESVVVSSDKSAIEVSPEENCSTKDNEPIEDFMPETSETEQEVNAGTVESEQKNTEEKVYLADCKADVKSPKTYNSMQQGVTEEMGNNLPQTHYSDIHSEGSSDSGKGSSDIQINDNAPLHIQMTEDGLSVYEFELPQDLCGRLIGRQGKSVNYIKNHSNANVFIKKHPVNSRMKICTIEGSALEITTALDYIRRRFPPSQFPNLALTPYNTTGSACGLPVPDTLQLHLPDGVSCDVMLSSMVTASHFFLQQPTHPTYPNLSRLDNCMAACYSQMDTPQLPQPVEAGVICAAPVLNGWFRAQVVYICDDTEECCLKFVDYGGYSRVPISSLRQIRSDFMTLPFQASECYLANVQSLDDKDGTWSVEACATFEELAQGQVLQANVVCYADDGIPFVHLYRLHGLTTVFINEEMVNRGVAQWIEHQ